MEEPIVEIYINTGNDEDDKAINILLDTLNTEAVIQRTLQIVNVQQPVVLSLMLTNDDEIQELNKQYRQQDKPTDVLSFPLLDTPLIEAPAEWLWQHVGEAEIEEETLDLPRVIPAFVTPAELSTNLGDIVISWPTIQRQASSAGHSVAYELLFLLCHGVLHLVGYDDQAEAGYAEMMRLQKEILATVPSERLRNG